MTSSTNRRDLGPHTEQWREWHEGQRGYSRTTYFAWAALCVMVASSTWSIAAAIDMRRVYQDSWVLQDLWMPLALTIAAYVIAAVHLRHARQLALLASALAILLNLVPALKYAYPYAPTSDTADHVQLMRALITTAQVDPATSYQDTPGLHLLVAALVTWSGTSLWLWSRLLPSLLGSLLPLGYYLLCACLSLPGELARWVLGLSPFAVPVLYVLHGTSFSAPLLVALPILLLVRESRVERPKRGACTWELKQTVLLYLLAGALIFWHPLSSLLYPLALLAAGILGGLRPVCRRACAASGALASLGASMSIAVLVYWACRADYVWARLLRNLRLLLEPARTPRLVPSRLGELDLVEQARMALLFHARDAVLLALAAGGVFCLACGLLRHAAHAHSPSYPRPHPIARRALHTYSLVALVFAAVFCAVFARGFGAQGYSRFLIYLVTLSPLPAGYVLWRGASVLHSAIAPDERRVWFDRLACGVVLGVIAVLSCVQLYPYQPAVPTRGPEEAGQDTTPVVWMHLVNSEYQRQLLRYAEAELPREAQLVVDYAGHRQARLYSSPALQERLRRTEQARPMPAFLLLHWPGAAGPYMEQAEYRSLQAIQAWRDRPGLSTIYDNGGAFILYYPGNGSDPFRLEPAGE